MCGCTHNCFSEHAGTFYGLSIGTRIDVDDSIAITPNKVLHLSVSKELYQSLGLEGHVSAFARKHHQKYSKCILKTESHAECVCVCLRAIGKSNSLCFFFRRIFAGVKRKMPNLKQPQPLETYALKALVQYLCSLGEKLMPIIGTLSKRASNKSGLVLEQRIQMLRNIFEYNVPGCLYDRLCSEIFVAVPLLIERIKKRLRPRSAMAEFLNQVNVAVSLTEVAISRNLRQINFETMPKMIRHIYYTRLNALTGLVHLNLGSLSGGWKTDEMEPTVLNGIRLMTNLRYFCLNYDCTDNILCALVDKCTQLHTLDISSSKAITNDSIHILTRMLRLRVVQLYRTSVSMEGYVNLLLKNADIQDIGRYEEIGRCLEYIVGRYPDRQSFSLTKFSSRFVTTNFLQILCDHCPNIYFVSIFHNLLLCDLMQLVGINKLSELKLLSCDFFADQIRNVLAVKGCNLSTLHLEHVDEIDMNALMYISQFCPDLQCLTLYNCVLIESTSMYIQRPTVPPFCNLQRLTLIAQCELDHLEFLLKSCYNVRSITIGTMVPTNDQLFERILARNPLARLQELSIVCSAELTVATVYRLIETCPELMVVNELEGWAKVSDIELKMLQLFIQTNNLNLNIESKRFVNEPIVL